MLLPSSVEVETLELAHPEIVAEMENITAMHSNIMIPDVFKLLPDVAIISPHDFWVSF